MEELTKILQEHNMDTTSLQRLFPTSAGEVFSLPIPATSVLAQWRRLRALVEQTSYWPVLLGDRYHGEASGEWKGDPAASKSPPTGHTDPRSVQEILEKALTLDPLAFLKQRWAQMRQEWESELQEDRAQWAASGAAEQGWDWTGWPHGDWLETRRDYESSIQTQRAKFSLEKLDETDVSLLPQPAETALLALLPTTLSWQVPAFFNLGNFNECPPPEIHVSLLQWWHAIYGAEVVALSHDRLELFVARPPEHPEQALALAQEHLMYCYDRYDDLCAQAEAPTIESFSSLLLNTPSWFFWWD